MFEFLFKKPQETKSAPLIALQLTGAPRARNRDYASLAREALLTNAVAYRCVRMIAEGAASVPWLLYDGATELDSHPLLALLSRPNPEEDGTTFFERWYSFLQSAGNAYLQAATAGGEVLRALRSAARSRHGRAGRERLAVGLRLHGGWDDDAHRARRGDRLHAVAAHDPVSSARRLLRPLADHRGGERDRDPQCAARPGPRALLDNAARPSGALVYKGPDGAPGLTDDQFTRLKRELEDAYQGSTNAGRPMVLEGGLDWKAMSFTPADMDFASSRNLAAREIALAFGVPPMLMGIPGDSTFANYKEANLTFWRQTVLPLVARTASAFTRWLGPRFGAGLRVELQSGRGRRAGA